MPAPSELEGEIRGTGQPGKGGPKEAGSERGRAANTPGGSSLPTSLGSPGPHLTCGLAPAGFPGSLEEAAPGRARDPGSSPAGPLPSRVTRASFPIPQSLSFLIRKCG